MVRIQGVVLRVKNRNESDRLLTVLSPELGKIIVMSRGSRKPKSKFLAFSQLFCYGELILKPYRDIYILNQADVKNSYYDIRNDLDRLSCATYISNLTEEVATAGERNTSLFALLLHGLSYLSYDERDPLETTLIYEIKLLEVAGYKPSIALHLSAGDIPGERYELLDAGITIDKETAKAIQRILNSSHDQAQKISMSRSVRQELNKVLPAYFQQILDLQIPSRSFLKFIS